MVKVASWALSVLVAACGVAHGVDAACKSANCRGAVLLRRCRRIR
jgi:hypothetical protein